MVIYRCTVCGYLHVAEVPEKCPMCGVTGDKFEEYTLPDLKGTKTYDNLMAAFAGESQANRKYTLYKQVALAEGHPESATAFDRPLREETAHALSHFIYMGLVGTTSENLQDAANGEAYEQDTMYPEFADDADKEGFHEIADYFRFVAKFEGIHKSGYLKAKEELDA